MSTKTSIWRLKVCRSVSVKFHHQTSSLRWKFLIFLNSPSPTLSCLDHSVIPWVLFSSAALNFIRNIQRRVELFWQIFNLILHLFSVTLELLHVVSCSGHDDWEEGYTGRKGIVCSRKCPFPFLCPLLVLINLPTHYDLAPDVRFKLCSLKMSDKLVMVK